MKTGCGGVSWDELGTPGGLYSVASFQSSRERVRRDLNSASSRAISVATRSGSTPPKVKPIDQVLQQPVRMQKILLNACRIRLRRRKPWGPSSERHRQSIWVT